METLYQIRKVQDIMRTLRQIKNILREGFVGMWRNFGMTTASIVSITFVLIIFGIISLLVLNVEEIVHESGEKLQKIVVFLDDGLTEDQIQNLGKNFQNMEGVTKVDYTSKDQALEDMKDRLKGDEYILEGLPNNPLPVSFTLHLKNLDNGYRVAKQSEKMDGVYKVQYYNDLVNRMLKVYQGVRYGGAGIITVLFIISMVLIHNTIRIALQNRSKEIQIMRYVGANNYYIRGPFLVEGVLFGLFAGLLATLVLFFAYQFVFNRFNPQLINVLGIGLFSPDRSLSLDLAIILASLGMGIGYLGSIISVTRHLDV